MNTTATALQRIERIIVVIMENRSFDHVLGYLSLPGGRTNVEGLGDEAWRMAHANPGEVGSVPPFALTRMEIPDPPHERDPIALQLGRVPGGPEPMRGFVRSYEQRPAAPDDPSLVMGFYRGPQVPMADFFAREFLICDHWFASLPTGTQPNRLMAMGGTTSIDTNARLLLPNQDLVYDWLERANVRWRVYHQGALPFFALMPKWQSGIAEGLAVDFLGIHTKFRRYEHFERDFYGDPTLPPVIFVEPEYTDGPHRAPNDDHPPTSIAIGQAFLYSIYCALMKRPDRWAKTLMIVTYDEHGGFFDHVAPLAVGTPPPLGYAYQPFDTSGVRVPAFLVSPFAKRGGVFSGPLDHTSLLTLLADRFTPGREYSDAVAHRSAEVLSARLVDVLLTESRRDLPVPSPVAAMTPPQLIPPQASMSGAETVGTAANAAAFRTAARTLVEDQPLARAQLIPEIGHLIGTETP